MWGQRGLSRCRETWVGLHDLVRTDLSRVLNLALMTSARVTGYFLILSSVKLSLVKMAAFQKNLVNDSQTFPVLTCCLTQEWVNTESGLTASQLAKASLALCTELCLKEREKHETRRSKRVAKLSSGCPFNTHRQVHFIHLRRESDDLSCNSFTNLQGCTAGATGSAACAGLPAVHRNASGLNVPWKYKVSEGLLTEILIKIRKPLRSNIFVAPSLSYRELVYLKIRYSPLCKWWLGSCVAFFFPSLFLPFSTEIAKRVH